MKRLLRYLLPLVFVLRLISAQDATVKRNVYLRSSASTASEALAKLSPGTTIHLLEPAQVGGFYHVKASDGQTGYVWGRNVNLETGSSGSSVTIPQSPIAPGAPVPLLAKGHPVDWWFVFKLNSAVFPGCGGGAARSCIFGGEVQSYSSGFGQQFAYASSESPALQEGQSCVGDSTNDPVGATYEEVYDGSFYYVVWNDQFYGDPAIKGCTSSCDKPWGHSKGMVAWDDAGDGLVLQVSTPSWPASGSSSHPRSKDGNTLGCVASTDNVIFSQHFFALTLTKDDLVKVLKALQNASVATDPQNLQIVKNGGPSDVQDLVGKLGVLSHSQTYTKDVLSTGVTLISKPSDLNVPPWQAVSAILGGVSLKAATWWATPKIDSTMASTPIDCWSPALSAPGAVDIVQNGQWNHKTFGLTGGPAHNANHAKAGVSFPANTHYAIFGDMNQQGTLSGPNCASSQNGRGGLFYVLTNEDLFTGVSALLGGQ